jgi:hypothetical protein
MLACEQQSKAASLSRATSAEEVGGTAFCGGEREE